MSWQNIRWRMAANIRDAFESPRGQVLVCYLALIGMALVFLLRLGDRGQPMLVEAVIINMGCLGIACIAMPFDTSDSEEERRDRRHAKLFAIASILLSGVIIFHKFMT